MSRGERPSSGAQQAAFGRGFLCGWSFRPDSRSFSDRWSSEKHSKSTITMFCYVFPQIPPAETEPKNLKRHPSFTKALKPPFTKEISWHLPKHISRHLPKHSDLIYPSTPTSFTQALKATFTQEKTQGSRMKWFSFSLIFNLCEEHFSCEASDKSVLQEKSESTFTFQTMRRGGFLANCLLKWVCKKKMKALAHFYPDWRALFLRSVW